MHMGKARVSFNNWSTVDDPAVAALSLPVSGMDFQDWILCVVCARSLAFLLSHDCS